MEAGFAISVYEGIEADPSIETVMQGAQAMLDFKPDWIVAMGGGSVIDAAKAMWIKYEVPDITFEEMQKPLPKLRRKAHDSLHFRHGDGSHGVFHYYGLQQRH